jgi:hypothetical protein
MKWYQKEANFDILINYVIKENNFQTNITNH